MFSQRPLLGSAGPLVATLALLLSSGCATFESEMRAGEEAMLADDPVRAYASFENAKELVPPGSEQAKLVEEKVCETLVRTRIRLRHPGDVSATLYELHQCKVSSVPTAARIADVSVDEVLDAGARTLIQHADEYRPQLTEAQWERVKEMAVEGLTVRDCIGLNAIERREIFHACAKRHLDAANPLALQRATERERKRFCALVEEHGAGAELDECMKRRFADVKSLAPCQAERRSKAATRHVAACIAGHIRWYATNAERRGGLPSDLPTWLQATHDECSALAVDLSSPGLVADCRRELGEAARTMVSRYERSLLPVEEKPARARPDVSVVERLTKACGVLSTLSGVDPALLAQCRAALETGMSRSIEGAIAALQGLAPSEPGFATAWRDVKARYALLTPPQRSLVDAKLAPTLQQVKREIDRRLAARRFGAARELALLVQDDQPGALAKVDSAALEVLSPLIAEAGPQRRGLLWILGALSARAGAPSPLPLQELRAQLVEETEVALHIDVKEPVCAPIASRLAAVPRAHARRGHASVDLIVDRCTFDSGHTHKRDRVERKTVSTGGRGTSETDLQKGVMTFKYEGGSTSTQEVARWRVYERRVSGTVSARLLVTEGGQQRAVPLATPTLSERWTFEVWQDHGVSSRDERVDDVIARHVESRASELRKSTESVVAQLIEARRRELRAAGARAAREGRTLDAMDAYAVAAFAGAGSDALVPLITQTWGLPADEVRAVTGH